MKLSHLLIITIAAILSACTNNAGERKADMADTLAASPDTGFTGIKQFMSGQYLVSEVTFKNSIREGLTKTFYKSGKLQRTYWYEKGLRQDSSCWFYEEGQLFRTTPFKNDTIEGIQRQFYRTGQLKAKMGYKNGYRTGFFQEFTREGKLVTGYPDVLVKTEDSYTSNGNYRIILELPDKKTDVRFFRGDFYNGVYDTTRVRKIRTAGNTGYLDLKKTGSPQQKYVGVIAEILTNYGNRFILYKKIDLPYNDLE
ncbi:MAG TPA: hypothetical protein VHO46_02175 [Bacteroidales bacterium]|nr:hypothetical protein [Bacteroidales bacterium]